MRDRTRGAPFKAHQANRGLDEHANRLRQLGRIHQGKKALGMDDATYRAFLENVAGCCSSKDMTTEQRNQVLAEMARRGFKAEEARARASAHRGRPANVQAVPMLRKVEALLADAKRPWSYAHAMAKRMHQVDRVEFLNPHQLHSLIAALQADAKRHPKGKR